MSAIKLEVISDTSYQSPNSIHDVHALVTITTPNLPIGHDAQTISTSMVIGIDLRSSDYVSTLKDTVKHLVDKADDCFISIAHNDGYEVHTPSRPIHAGFRNSRAELSVAIDQAFTVSDMSDNTSESSGSCRCQSITDTIRATLTLAGDQSRVDKHNHIILFIDLANTDHDTISDCTLLWDDLLASIEATLTSYPMWIFAFSGNRCGAPAMDFSKHLEIAYLTKVVGLCTGGCMIYSDSVDELERAVWTYIGTLTTLMYRSCLLIVEATTGVRITDSYGPVCATYSMADRQKIYKLGPLSADSRKIIPLALSVRALTEPEKEAMIESNRGDKRTPRQIILRAILITEYPPSRVSAYLKISRSRQYVPRLTGLEYEQLLHASCYAKTRETIVIVLKLMTQQRYNKAYSRVCCTIKDLVACYDNRSPPSLGHFISELRDLSVLVIKGKISYDVWDTLSAHRSQYGGIYLTVHEMKARRGHSSAS